MIRVERHNRVAVITLARADARNAINRALEQSLYDALESLDSDPELRVGVIAAEGSTFCAGADLKEIAEKGNPRGPGALSRESIVSRKRIKPLIAAVEGGAYGGGMELVLSCDCTVASRSAKFALSEVRWGLLPSGGGMFRLPRALPRAIAMQILMTGAPITAERAFQLGLVNELTDPGGALDVALTMARQIADNGPLAIRFVREMVEQAWFLDEADSWALSRDMVSRNFASDDAKEGPSAFAEKRSPNWRSA